MARRDAAAVGGDPALAAFGGLTTTFDVDDSSSTVVLTGPITGGGPSDFATNLSHTVFRVIGTNSATTGTRRLIPKKGVPGSGSRAFSCGKLLRASVTSAGSCSGRNHR